MSRRSNRVRALVAVGTLACLALAVWWFRRPLPPETLFAVARAAIDRNDFGYAERQLRGYIEQSPTSGVAAARMMLGQLLFKTGRGDAGVEMMTSIPDSAREAAGARLAIGNYYWDRAEFARAESGWIEARRINPRVPEAGWWLLDLYQTQGRLADAQRLALEMYDVEPDARDRVGLLWELIRQEHERLEPRVARDRMRAAVKNQPDDLNSQIALVRSYIGLGEPARAVELGRDLVAKHAESVRLWEALLDALIESGDFDAIRQLLSTMPPAVAADWRIRRSRAMLLESEGDWLAARDLLERVLAEQPAERKIHFRLSRVLRRLNRQDDADRHEQRSRELDQSRERLGELYASRQDGVLTAAVCAEAARHCRELGRIGEADRWDREAKRRTN